MCFLRLAFTPATVTGEAGGLAEAAWQPETSVFMCWGRVFGVFGDTFTDTLFTVWFMCTG